MQVTLINTRGTLEVAQRDKNGNVEQVGTFEIMVADPGFIQRTRALIAYIGSDATAEQYEELAAQCADAIRLALVHEEDAETLLGGKPDLYRQVVLLDAILRELIDINPDRQLRELMEAHLVPSADALAAEMARS